jgi:Tfp pilus assembly protein PilF
MQKGMMEQAVQSFHNALKIDPDSAVAHLNLGNAYLSLGEIDKSIEHNGRAVEIHPGFAMAHNNLAVALFHKGESEKARKHVKAKDSRYPVNIDFLKELREE